MLLVTFLLAFVPSLFSILFYIPRSFSTPPPLFVLGSYDYLLLRDPSTRACQWRWRLMPSAPLIISQNYYRKLVLTLSHEKRWGNQGFYEP